MEQGSSIRGEDIVSGVANIYILILEEKSRIGYMACGFAPRNLNTVA